MLYYVVANVVAEVEQDQSLVVQKIEMNHH
jgi:hypothetical protein